jgi:hypothetical protein
MKLQRKQARIQHLPGLNYRSEADCVSFPISRQVVRKIVNFREKGRIAAGLKEKHSSNFILSENDKE